MPPAARQIAVPDEPAAWERLGFAVEEGGAFEVGGVVVATDLAVALAFMTPRPQQRPPD